MSDALVSPGVAVGGGVIAFSLIAVAAQKLRDAQRADSVAMMGVMGAFVFAAQMINFSIPATGSSGHLIGGILLSAMLGPWAGFITLCSVLIVQCLVFADGGLMALGCNILNMAVTSCLIGYPLVYRPLTGNNPSLFRICVASILSCVVSLELGAFGVTLETELSGVTALPMSMFLKFMLPIHLLIGLVEGVATAAILVFIAHRAPEFLTGEKVGVQSVKKRKIFVWFGVITIILAALFTWLASENPDGLEWSIEKVSGIIEFDEEVPSTAIMPGYNSSIAGIVGALIVMALLWAFSSLLFTRLGRNRR